MPTGPGAAARGPVDIEKRLRLGLEGLAGYDHGPATIIAEGADGIQSPSMSRASPPRVSPRGLRP